MEGHKEARKQKQIDHVDIFVPNFKFNKFAVGIQIFLIELKFPGWLVPEITINSCEVIVEIENFDQGIKVRICDPQQEHIIGKSIDSVEVILFDIVVDQDWNEDRVDEEGKNSLNS